jgi:hypothetical protein
MKVTAAPLVIPSAAEGPAVRPSLKQLPAALSATTFFPMEAPPYSLSSRLPRERSRELHFFLSIRTGGSQ